MKDKRSYFSLLTLLLLGGFAFFLIPGIPSGHDAGFHLSRLWSLNAGLKEGYFPVFINFASLNGMGYGAGLFYSDLLLLPAAFLTLAGVSLVGACKILMMLLTLGSGWSMYYVMRQMKANQFGAFTGALLYCWSSYLAVDIFVRAAMGEVMAFVFIPWIILGIYRILYDDCSKFLPLSLGFAGLCYVHLISLVMMGVITAIIFALNFRILFFEWRRVSYIILAGVVTLGLAAFALGPMLEQLAALRFNLTAQTAQSPIHERTIPFLRLFLELPYTKLKDWIPPGIGTIFVIASLQRFRLKSGRSNEERFMDIALIAGIGSLLAATEFLPWEGIMRLLSAIQFPWRFYLPATAFLAVAGGMILMRLTGNDAKKRHYWLVMVLCGCAFAWFFNVAYCYAAKLHEKNFFHRFGHAAMQRYSFSGQHYLPQGVAARELAGKENTVIVSSKAASAVLTRPQYGKMCLDVRNVSAGDRLEVPLVPYKGYQAMVGDRRLKTDFSRGKFEIIFEELQHHVYINVTYQNTFVQKSCMVFSAFSLLFVVVYEILMRNKRKKNEKKY